MVSGNGTLGEQVKEQLGLLLLKFLTTIQSRKFWATVVGVVAVAQQMAAKAISPEIGITEIVTLLIAYAGLTVADDYLTRKVM